MTTPPARGRRPWSGPVDTVVLALVAYVPFLLSAPGELSSDSKQALYVDPGGFLREAAYLWDPSVGAGTVPHQHIGYLWPMGPWFWCFDAAGVPDWIAQRLWLGTLTLVAALGMRWLVRSLGLGRTAALAGAFVYALSPYQLAFTARTSVLLLPWVGLPWLVELTRRAVHHGGWRHPAAFALVTFSVAGVNAASLLLVAVAPLVVLLDAARPSRRGGRAAAGAAVRIGALTLPICLWWLAGLRVQGAHGMPVLQLTENLRTVAERSTPDDALRGLGNWFFYGSDRAGWSLDQADYYEHHPVAIALSFVVPVLALAVATVLRWRERAVLIGFLGAMVVAVGAWPYDHPSPAGRLFRAVVEGTSAGLAFRNHPRVVPVVVLALGLVLAAGVAAMPGRARWAAGAVVVVAALAGLAPVARVGMLSDGMNRPEDLPAHWEQAADHLDAQGTATRVLELPGANFADYRWGNAVEPVTPLLVDRSYVAREILPYGSPESALLLDALDRRIQNGVLDPASLAPVARLLAAGSVVLRNDLRFERFATPGPDSLWALVVEPRAGGLGDPTPFGAPVVNEGDPALDPLVPSDLLGDRGVDRTTPLPPVAVLEVDDARPIVRVAATEGPVVLAGDADGIVDAAAAGLLDGRALVLLSGSLTDRQLADAAAGDAALVVTDGNRRRIQTWFYSLRETRGPTEEAGETMVEPSGYDARLHAFPDPDDSTRTVVDQIGATVRASSAGGGAARPEDRPVAAVDGRLDSSWRVGGADPTGERLSARLDEPRTVDRVVLVQPQDGPRDRRITRARLRFDDGTAVDVDLGPASVEPGGQVVAVPEREVRSISVEILEVSDPGFDPGLANAVGFAEIGLGDLRVQETVTLPSDLLARLGSASIDRSLDLVLTRLRTSPDDWTRGDDEALLDRSFDLPTTRSFTLTGTGRPATGATDPVVDDLLGTGTPSSRITSSSRLPGPAEARASRAFDGDPTTAWTAAFDDRDPWIEVTADRAVALGDDLRLDVLADGRHSLPGVVSVTVDGEVVAVHEVGPLDEGTDPGHRTTVSVPLGSAPRTGRTVRVHVTSVVPRFSDTSTAAAVLPVGITEVGGIETAAATTGIVDPACRSDLVTVDGEPVPVRLGDPSPAGTLSVEACAGLELGAGPHRLRSSPGAETGLDLDALVLSSAPGGDAGDPSIRGAAADEAPARVTSQTVDRTGVRATVDADGEPFWFVLAQSTSDGWSLDVEGGTVGPRALVDGYADGWVVTPDGPGPVTMTLTWTPQRTVWVAMAVSLLTLVVAAVILARSPTAGRVPAGPPPRYAALRAPRHGVDPSAAAAASTGAGGRAAGVMVAAMAGAAVAASGAALVVSRPWIAAVVGLTAAVVTRWRRLTWPVAGLAGLTLALARPLERPELGWLAIGFVVAVVAADAVRSRSGAAR
jgi:arabinofuranan 3-O-arabinosyltransferase